jgi:hypothetical protein
MADYFEATVRPRWSAASEERGRRACVGQALLRREADHDRDGIGAEPSGARAHSGPTRLLVSLVASGRLSGRTQADMEAVVAEDADPDTA